MGYFWREIPLSSAHICEAFTSLGWTLYLLTWLRTKCSGQPSPHRVPSAQVVTFQEKAKVCACGLSAERGLAPSAPHLEGAIGLTSYSRAPLYMLTHMLIPLYISRLSTKPRPHHLCCLQEGAFLPLQQRWGKPVPDLVGRMTRIHPTPLPPSPVLCSQALVDSGLWWLP